MSEIIIAVGSLLIATVVGLIVKIRKDRLRKALARARLIEM
jgi:hypothetical protein